MEDCIEVKEAITPTASQAQRTAKSTTSDKSASTLQETQLIVTNVESTVPEELPQSSLFDESFYLTLFGSGVIILSGLCAFIIMVSVMKRK